jgi:hypothetical protein
VRRILFAIVLLVVLPYVAKGQEQQFVQTSTPPSDARYEIVATSAGSKWTLKLDRVTGNVERLAIGKSGNLAWRKMRILPHPKAVNTVKPHYQLVSGQADQPMLLLDTESGATWRLVTNGDISLWQPIE